MKLIKKLLSVMIGIAILFALALYLTYSAKSEEISRALTSAVPAVVSAPAAPAAPAIADEIPKVVINGTTYSLSTNQVVASMVDGEGNKNFGVTVRGNVPFGFSVHGYGNGFPTYGIIAETASGGVDGAFNIQLYFNDSYLSADGDKPRVYSGHLPIHIYQGSETGFDTNFLYLKVVLTVYPAKSPAPVPPPASK
ncbi:MAG: hypothetical protein RIT04_63 [Candidatus Parcubacteria bacterium]|jgi:hypothetical protein